MHSDRARIFGVGAALLTVALAAQAEDWTPAEIATALWLDASDVGTITQSGGAVSQWADKSGNAKHATQATGSRQPVYTASDAMLGGRPSVGTGGLAGKYFWTPSAGGKRIYAVLYFGDGTQATWPEHDSWLSGPGTSGEWRITGRTGRSIWDEARDFNDAGTYRDGSTTSSRDALPMPATLWKFDASATRTQTWKILCGNSASWARWNGALGELIFTDGTETLATQQKMEGYLAWKWGLEGNLPAVHPYKSAPPTTGPQPVPGAFEFSAADHVELEGDSGSRAVTVTVTRVGGTDGAVSVDYATSDGTATLGDNDYAAASGTLIWADGDGVDKTFDITLIGDTTPEGDESFGIALSNATGGAALGPQSTATVTITNDDPVTPPELWSGLMGWWRFDEAGGVVAFDSSGKEHNGILKNMAGTEWTSGMLNGALAFDGANDLVDTGLLASQLGVGDGETKSVATWCCVNVFDGGGLYQMGYANNRYHFGFKTLSADNNWQITNGRTGGDHYSFDTLADFGISSKGTWVHFVHIYEDGVTKLYLNGELVVTWSAVGSIEENTTLRFGRFHKGTLDGSMDDVRIYDRALTADEVIALYGLTLDTTAPTTPADLAATVEDQNKIGLSWTASTDDNEVAGYEVYRDGVQIAIANGTSYVDEDVLFDTAYVYTVKAFDLSSNVSPASSAATITMSKTTGSGTGLAAVYYDNDDFTGLSVTGIDSVIDVNYGKGSPDPAIDKNYFSILWTGSIEPYGSNTYTFHGSSDDTMKVWIGGRVVIDTSIRKKSGSIPLIGGCRYPIRIEFVEKWGNAFAKLEWQSPSMAAKEVVPQNQLYPTGPALGLTTSLSSATSPVWVEGDCEVAADSVWVTVDGGVPFEAVREGTFRWYADDPTAEGPLGIPLTQAAPSVSVTVESKSGDTVISSVTETITWTVTDLAGKSASADAITIRKGDSLLLTATGSGTTLTLDIDNDGTPEFTGAPADTFAALYDTAGTFTAVALIDDSEVGSLTVTVIDVVPVPAVGVWKGRERLKTMQISPTGVLWPPPEVAFVPSDLAVLDVAVDSIAPDSATLALDSYETGTTSLQVRVGGATGPVVLDQEVHSFTLRSLNRVVAPALISYPDGDELSGFGIRMEPYYPGHVVYINIWGGGGLFEDSGTSVRYAATDDFDENGDYIYYVIAPSIICHSLAVSDEE